MDGHGRAGHELSGPYGSGLGGRVELVGAGYVAPELLLCQQIGLRHDPDDSSLPLQNGQGAHFPLVHERDDLLVRRVTPDGDGSVGHDVADCVARGGQHVLPEG